MFNDPYAEYYKRMTLPDYSPLPTPGEGDYDFTRPGLSPAPITPFVPTPSTPAPKPEDSPTPYAPTVTTPTPEEKPAVQEYIEARERDQGDGRDKGDHRKDKNEFAYEPGYWGNFKGGWSPELGTDVALKSLGYGKAVGGAMRGGLLGNLLGLGGNPLNPLNDPANIEGLRQAGIEYGFSPELMSQAIQNMYDGVTPGAIGAMPQGKGFLGSLLGGFLGNTTDAKVNATGTMKGLVGMAGPWQDVIDWNTTNFTNFDPTSPTRLNHKDLDPHVAAQMMDSYRHGFGVAPSQYGIGMYQNLAMDPTLKPGWMAQYSDALSSGNPIGISGKMAAREAERNGIPGAPKGMTLDSHEAGLVAGGVMNADGTVGNRGFQSKLNDWVDGKISTKDILGTFSDYKKEKNVQQSPVGKSPAGKGPKDNGGGDRREDRGGPSKEGPGSGAPGSNVDGDLY